MPLENRPRFLKPARHLHAHSLRVAGFAKRGRADHVCEQDGDGLAQLARRRGLAERRRAGPTEPEPVRILLTAAGADDGHEPSVRGRNPVWQADVRLMPD